MERDPLSGRYCGECGGLHPAEEGDFWAESSLLGLKITYFAMMEGKIYDITGGCHLPEPPAQRAPPAGLPPHPTGWPDGRARVSRQSGPAASAWGSPRTPTASPTTSPSAPGAPGRLGGRGRSQQQSGAGEGARARSWGAGGVPSPTGPPQHWLSPHRSASKGSPSAAADLQDFFARVFQGSSGPMPGGPFPPPPAPPGPAASPGVPPRAEGTAPKGDMKHKRRKKTRRPFQR